MSRRAADAGFVCDGRDRACRALRPTIVREVEAEYRERWNAASFWRRLMLYREISREIERRLGAQAPPDALY